MNTAGMIMMLVSNVVVITLCGYCFIRVLTTPGSQKHEHAVLDIDTRDTDPS